MIRVFILIFTILLLTGCTHINVEKASKLSDGQLVFGLCSFYHEDEYGEWHERSQGQP